MIHPDPNACGSPYWICDFCVRERGGVYFKSCSTAYTIECGYCKGEYQVERAIFPSLDHIWPSQAARDPERYREWAKGLAERWADHKVPNKELDPTDVKANLWQLTYEDEISRILKGWKLED